MRFPDAPCQYCGHPTDQHSLKGCGLMISVAPNPIGRTATTCPCALLFAGDVDELMQYVPEGDQFVQEEPFSLPQLFELLQKPLPAVVLARHEELAERTRKSGPAR